MEYTTPTRLNTVPRIAARLRVPPSRIEYITRAKGIAPIALAGRTRLYDAQAVARIRYENNLIDARRCDIPESKGVSS